MATSGMTEQLGRVLGGRYRLSVPVGTGASAQVFLADDVTLRRRVAVKLLHPALATDQSFLRRFRAEARAAAALSHPNLMAVYDWGEDDVPYLVLEFLGGGSLRGMLDAGTRLTLAQAVQVGLDAARALDAAHRRDVVHRDIKPANLLFGDDGRLRIADFGLARALSEAAWTEPGHGLVGTARYAAPEQATSPRIDGKADVYALGLVLIEAVTGQVPLTADTALGTLMRRVDVPVPVPAELGPLVGILERMGRPDPADRPTAAEVEQALVEAGAGLDRPEPLPLAGAVDAGAPHADPTLLPPSVLATAAPDAPGAGADGDVVAAGPAAPAGAGPADDGADAGSDVGPDTDPDTDTDARADAEPEAGGDGEPDDDDAPDGATTTGVPVAPGREVVTPTVVVESSGPRMALLDRRPDAVLVHGEVPGRSRRRRWPWVLLALVLLAGAVGGGVLAWLAAQPTSATVPRLLTLDQAAAEAEVAAVEASVEDGLDWTLDVATEHSEVVGEGFVIDQDPPPGTELDDGGAVSIVVSLGPPPRTVPDLSGRSEEEARADVEAAELVVGDRQERHDEAVEAGRVLTWSVDGVERPAEVPKGSEVDYVVSSGPAPRTVPDLAGVGLEDARAQLAALGLESSVVERFSNTVARGSVIATSPAAGTEVPRGDTVELTVSLGRDLVVVPEVAGMSIDGAVAALEAAGLAPDQVSGPAGGLVNATDPEAGASVDRGTPVDLFLRR